MRDLVTFDTGLVQVSLLLSQMRHTPSQQPESRAFSAFMISLCMQCLSHAVPVTARPNPEFTSHSQQSFICRQSIRIYKLLLANYQNSEFINTNKKKPSVLRRRFYFVWLLEVSRTAIICGYVSLKILVDLISKNFCIIFVEGKIMV